MKTLKASLVILTLLIVTSCTLDQRSATNSQQAPTNDLDTRATTPHLGASAALSLTSPSGGESWPVSNMQQIRWNTLGDVAQVRLTFSSDGFVTTSVIASPLDNTGAYAWTTPPTPTHSAQVRVASVVSPSVNDTSGAFSLYLSGTVHLPTVTNFPSSGALVQPGDLVYQGAFRLPGGDDRPQTFAYGGNAMTFNPNGDPGSGDAFPGSLFLTGHDRLGYGELPDGSQVAEISIPTPVVADDVSELGQGEFVQGFYDVTAGYFTGLEEIPRIGMQYVDTAATGPKLHLGWGQHLPPETPPATHLCFDPDLAAPDVQGTWFIGDQSFNSVNGYLFDIPAPWADAHAEGRYLATGRYRDGGWSGMGPALFAYRPWIDASGTPAPAGTHLEESVLLLYESSENTPNVERCLDGYQHPDEWEGGAWITTGSDKSALLFAGTKGTGTKYWYGFVNPAGPDVPCVHQESVGEFTACRLADGAPCLPEDLAECEGHNDTRGWWSARFDAQFILYDPAELAQAAVGAIAPWEPQPYASLDIDDTLFLNPAGIEPDMLGTGVQRRFRIGAVAYDRGNDLLYVLELFADQAKPVVHVWRVQ